MRRFGRTLPALTGFLAAALCIPPPRACADFVLTLQEDHNSATALHVGPGEDPNTVSFSGTVGGHFVVSITAVRTNGAGITITSADIRNTDGQSQHDLTVLVSATGFQLATPDHGLASRAAGSLVWGMVGGDFTAYADLNNQLLTDPGSAPAVSTPTVPFYVGGSTPSFAGQSSTSFTDPSGGPFSLSMVTQLHFGVNSEIALTGGAMVAPAPSGVMLVLSAVPVLGAGYRLRARKSRSRTERR
jgi:hypothetical protein